MTLIVRGGEGLAVRAEGDADDRAPQSEGGRSPTASRLPQAEVAVVVPNGENLAIRAEGEGVEPTVRVQACGPAFAGRVP